MEVVQLDTPAVLPSCKSSQTGIGAWSAKSPGPRLMAILFCGLALPSVAKIAAILLKVYLTLYSWREKNKLWQGENGKILFLLCYMLFLCVSRGVTSYDCQNKPLVENCPNSLCFILCSPAVKQVCPFCCSHSNIRVPVNHSVLIQPHLVYLLKVFKCSQMNNLPLLDRSW